MIDKILSQHLFRELMNGRVVNATRSDASGGREPNPLFEELFRQYDSDYRPLYEAIGYELVLKEGYAYVRSMEREESWNDVAMRVQALLLVLARGIQELGYDFSLLTTADAGVPEKLVEQIDSEERRDILQACGLKGSLSEELRKVLEGRQIAYRNARDALVLTEAGKGFFGEIFGDSVMEPEISA